jgi:spore coat polysaccharide biosynthesis protein SpsF (cytidylyltransferase family)
MKIVGIVQARASSTRLPSKVLLEAVGQPLILLMLERVKRCKLLDELWLATSRDESDDLLSEKVQKAGYHVFRGSLDHVLSRFWHIAKKQKADAVVRLTGDCPLHDSNVIDSVIQYYVEKQSTLDYVSNVLPPTYPDGLDAEIFSFSVLEAAFQNAKSRYDLEHVSPYIRRLVAETGRQSNMLGPADFSHLRWTLDEPEDYELINRIYEDLYHKKKEFGWLDVLAWQTMDEKRLRINSMHIRNAGCA